MSTPTPVPPHVVDGLKAGEPVRLDGGVVLKRPKDPTATGVSGCYRIDWFTRDGKRHQKARRVLEDAWEVAYAASERFLASETIATTGYHSRANFRALCEHYLEPSRHNDWGPSRADAVQSLVTCWLLADHIVVTQVDGTRVPLADLPVADLTPAILTEACGHVRSARAWRTYKEVHIIAGALTAWAVAERFLPPGGDLRGKFALAPRPKGATSGSATESRRAGHLPIPVEQIPPHCELARVAEGLGAMFNHRQQMLFELKMWAGFRIGEVLALRNDERFRWDEATGCWLVHVFERVEKSSAKTASPKWDRERWAWIPPFLTENVTKLLTETAKASRCSPRSVVGSCR